MFYIGCHLSSSKGYYHMGKEAQSIGANTFQFFTRNPRGGSAKPLDVDDCNKLSRFMKDNNFGKIVAHAPYTLNACAVDENIRKFAADTMKDDLLRMEHIPGNYYNFHPGSHVKQGVEKGIELISDMLNSILSSKMNTIVLLETMSGKGSEVGRNFKEIKAIMDRVALKEKLGVCIDTCHIFDGGYDIINNLEYVIEEFEKIIGLKNLKAIHINDSKNSFGSHKDRHELIGKGYIGIEALEKIINNPNFQGLPFILETPNDLKGYESEIRLLRELHQ